MNINVIIRSHQMQTIKAQTKIKEMARKSNCVIVEDARIIF